MLPLLCGMLFQPLQLNNFIDTSALWVRGYHLYVSSAFMGWTKNFSKKIESIPISFHSDFIFVVLPH